MRHEGQYALAQSPALEQAAEPAAHGREEVNTARPARLAWRILWASFIVFLLLFAAVAQVAIAYWLNATESKTALLVTSSGGTVLQKPARQVQWVDAVDGNLLHEGDRLRTDTNAQAMVDFFDNTRLRIFGNTVIQANRLNASRFNPDRTVVELAVLQGKMQVDVNPRAAAEATVLLVLPQATVSMARGSYVVNSGQQTLVRVSTGSALVTTPQRTYQLLEGERLEFTSNGSVNGPVRAPEELMVNGNFSDGLNAWEVQQASGFPGNTDVAALFAFVSDDRGGTALQFSRLGSKNSHYETRLVQKINRDVAEFRQVTLSLDLAIRYQSLSGGGYLGTEYPIRVRVDYQTADAEGQVVYGFFYQNVTNNRTDFGVQVPKDVWVSYTAPLNLMNLVPKPQRINSIQISASGWDLESRFTNVSLTAE